MNFDNSFLGTRIKNIIQGKQKNSKIVHALLGMLFCILISISSFVYTIIRDCTIQVSGINNYGETYGGFNGTDPDLTCAKNDKGTIGYVRMTDMEWYPLDGEKKIKKVPMYQRDGRTIIGYFKLE